MKTLQRSNTLRGDSLEPKNRLAPASGSRGKSDAAPRSLNGRSRYKKIQAEPLGKEFAHELSLHTISGRVEARSKNAESTLAWRNSDHAPADSALAGQSGIIQPVARILVKSRRDHYSQDVLAMDRVDDPGLGERVHAALAKVAAITARSFAVTLSEHCLI